MTSLVNLFAVFSTTLASSVANSGTFTIAYPTGFTQDSFTAGLARTNGYMVVNGNDRYAQGGSGFTVTYGASTITVTNTTGVTLPAGATISIQINVGDGNSRIPFVIPLPPLATITAADVITEVRPGIAGVIEHAEFVCTIAVTTASRAATLNMEIGTTDVTGGTIALTSAALTPKGVAIAAAAITGNNTLTRESKLSIEASSVTAFAEGEGYMVVYIRPTYDNQY